MDVRHKSVIARLATGLVIRGSTLDFTPDRPSFRVTPEGGGRGVEIRVKDLKALFFLRSPGGPAPEDRARAAWMDPRRDGKAVTVHFRDGESMSGLALSYRPEKPGFFLFPDDPDSQHEKIYVVTAAALRVDVAGAAPRGRRAA